MLVSLPTPPKNAVSVVLAVTGGQEYFCSRDQRMVGIDCPEDKEFELVLWGVDDNGNRFHLTRRTFPPYDHQKQGQLNCEEPYRVEEDPDPLAKYRNPFFDTQAGASFDAEVE